MSDLKMQRFQQLLNGELADRPIVSGWHHFLDKEQTAADLAEATIRFARKYDWDWIKINPRATYLAESFGNTYDFEDYRWVFPRQTKAIIQNSEDVWKLTKVDPANSAALQEQLEAVKLIRDGLPETPIIQTVFSPLTILMFLTGNSSYINQTMYGSETPVDFQKLIETERNGVHQALHTIAVTMASYVESLEDAGADGLFYAVTGTAHPDLFDEAAFNEFSRPYDLIVLNAMKKRGRILHTCGVHAQPERFDDYPVEGISWDTEAEGNPGLEIQLKKTKVAGIDHHIFEGDNNENIEQQAKGAIQSMANQPFLLVPNCAVSVKATEGALQALRNSVL
ncbi:uroporphyrinogen-III decarboxylase [Gracilibacillus oryzae]|uniref:Uroporphyrinogen-III decarboxylase n=1 Tax=Gracilibacillus oryzae TaxID=1672701 RepID=A0A7C8GQX9_9BACI|nr:uroporphyrinogen decarboxylase family protein [Gracilibacillus oryzae]KAB8126652.1 uroporphyrinogen-III decarboxylase [Gracilibacillus oryzae]